MLRISVVCQSPAGVVLKLEGWVSREAVGLLREEGHRWLGQEKGLVLDLEGVAFIDRAGLDLLAAWAAGGVKLRGGSLFVRTLLQRRGLAQEGENGR